MSEKEVIVSMKDICKSFPGVKALDHVQFELRSGEVMALLGENGAGKSTLMKAILGLKSPMAGKIETGDGLKPDEIGYLPQQTALQRDFPASVDEIVMSGFLGRMGLRPFYNKAAVSYTHLTLPTIA